jgi:hypothetical protein
MALARAYKIGVFDTATWLPTGATVTTTTTTPILYWNSSASSDLNISAVRCGIVAGSSFPANGAVVFSINTMTGTKAGGQAVTPIQLSGIAKASLLTAVSTAGGTSAAAITGLTATTSWWSQELPFTAGSNWGEWKTPGFEINHAVSLQFAVCVTASSAGTGTTFACEIEYTE